MKVFHKYIAIILLLIFTTYAIGVRIEIHSCKHCDEKKVFIFKHSHCCPLESQEHQHHAACQNDLFVGKHFKSHQSCCLTEFKYFKLNSLYTLPSLLSLIPFDLLLTKFIFSDYQLIYNQKHISSFTKIPLPLPEILSTVQGGNLFIISTQQQIFYA